MDAADKLSRYRLGEPLGHGGQGRTVAALDRLTDTKVAVKVIQLRGAGSWKPFELFERECQVLSSLDHPGIPNYLDTFAQEDEGTFFLVMELVDGKSLRDLMEEGQLLSEAQLWNVLHQALEILDYLHGRRPPVVHRDIKPANLIRRPDNRLALVDFGGVRMALREDGGSTVVGTFGYMAPEQLHGEATAATDIYGLGATLAAMATGIEADKLPRKGLKVKLEPVLQPSALRDLLGRMLEPDPEDRLPSVTAVREAIRKVETTAGSAADRQRDAAAIQPVGDPDLPAHPLHGLPAPLSALLRIVGVFGFVGLAIVDAIILPLVFVMFGSAWSKEPNKLKRLKQRRDTARKALGSGRRALGALARGRNPYRTEERGLPPGPETDDRRRLPPGDHLRGRGGRRRGRGRRR